MISVAIDGPGGAGKSTIARRIAKDMGYIYIDTGALYRAIGLYAVLHTVPTQNAAAVAAILPNISLELRHIGDEQHVFLNGEDVSGAIRKPVVTAAASHVSAHKEVRDFLLQTQREMAERYNVLMDGRDIGTVILPNADVKIFLTASPEERARRRFLEHQERGDDVTYETVLHDINQRDYNDSHRDVAPLKQADDAVLVDTTGDDLETAIARIKAIIEEKIR